jgi:hypothetical protein
MRLEPERFAELLVRYHELARVLRHQRALTLLTGHGPRM